MINLNQSIAKVKAELIPSDSPHAESVEMSREGWIELIMHEGAGRDRKTLLEWLNEQVELLPAGVDPVPDVSVETYATGVPPQGSPVPPRAKPVYRPEMRGGVWCLYDVNNGELRNRRCPRETFDNKGEAKAFAERLEAGEELDVPYLHVSG